MNKRYIQYEAHYPSGGERSGICSIYGGARTLSATESKQPTSVLIVNESFKKIKAKINVITTLSLSTGTTFETSPICNAL